MSNELYHYGIKGQQWGRRRYQNEDGTLTIAGKKRYADQLHSPYVTSNPQADGSVQVNTVRYNNGKIFPSGRTVEVSSSRTITYKKDSNGNYVVRGAGGKDVTLSKDQAGKNLRADYADLTDEELDKVYEITGDISALKYRNKRRKVVGQEFANEKKSLLKDLLAVAANAVDNAKAWIEDKLDDYAFMH